MRIIVFGANGQLGQELLSLRDVPGFDSHDGDITDPDKLRPIFKEHKPDYVINAAAYTNVDAAEDNEALANAVNGDGVRNLAIFAKEYGAKLIHVSTDYVFNGAQELPYAETDPIDPIGAYGRSKALGEKALKRIGASYVTLRTAWVYSAFGHNFVKTMLNLAQTRDTLSVVDSQHGCPTYARDLAEMIYHIVDGPAFFEGTYHYTGKGATTWYDFAREIFACAADYGIKTPEILPVDTFPAKSKRPTFSMLNCTKIEHTFGKPCKDWKISLSECIKRIFS